MHPVLSTILKRLGLGIFTLFMVSIVIFSSISMLPGDFTQAVLGQSATTETVAAFRKELGLDRSRPVVSLVAPRLWNTLFLAMVTALVAVPLSLILGITAALYRNSYYDRSVNATTLVTISMPRLLSSWLIDPTCLY